jgi:ribosomal protein S18 acetylase RimI-like enzyme
MKTVDFVRTSTLQPTEIGLVRELLISRPLFQLYFETAVDALRDRLDNRSILIGHQRRGLAISIEFYALAVRTTIGELSDEEIQAVASTPGAAELHLEPSHFTIAKRVTATRRNMVKRLRFYKLSGGIDANADCRCRALGPSDISLVQEFYQSHDRLSIFSPWMLRHPFIGLFEGGKLLACGGVIVSHERLRLAVIGNILTHPLHRGRGLGRAIVVSLVQTLVRTGFGTVMLSVTENNGAAVRVYEAVGFEHFETRPLIELPAAAD